MGGEQDTIGIAEAASSLRWWLESGVDVAVQEEPRNWLAPSPAKRRIEPPPAEAAPALPRGELPTTMAEFRAWMAEAPDLPLARRGAARVLPVGTEAPAIMLVSDGLTREEEVAGTPMAGEAAALMERMLAAIGLSGEQAYSAPLACFHAPGARMEESELAACAELVRHQVRLVKPKLLLLLGQGPARALLGKPIIAARGHVHKVEGVRTVATFHPRHLLKHPSEKALAWRDLLLLTEEDK